MTIHFPDYRLSNMSNVRKYEVFSVNDKLLIKVLGLKAVDLDSRRSIKLLGSTPCFLSKLKVKYSANTTRGKFKNLRLYDIFVNDNKTYVKINEISAVRLNYDGIIYNFCPADDVKRVEEVVI